MRLNNACCIYALFISDNENLDETLLTGEFFQTFYLYFIFIAMDYIVAINRMNKDI